MKYFYFDNNIYIDLKNNRSEELTKVVSELERTTNRIVFSPAHIEEIGGTVQHYGQSIESAHEKLDFVRELTGSYCFLPFPRSELKLIHNKGILIYNEDPVATFRRVFSLNHLNKIPEQHQKRKLEHGEYVEEQEKLIPIEVNNTDISKALDLYRQDMYRIVIEVYKKLKKNAGMKRYVPRERITINMLNFAALNKYFPMFEMVVELLMEHLEKKRYFPDKSQKNIASLHDTTHAIYGAYADVFVTNDYRFSEKVKAVYKWLGVETKVLTRKEFIKEFSKCNETT